MEIKAKRANEFKSVRKQLALRKLIVKYAFSFLGKPYHWGGDDPMAGFDCSGMIVELLTSIGILPRGVDYTAQGLWDKFRADAVKQPIQGSLVFYYNTDKSRIIHVALMIDKEHIIEASGGGSSTITTQDAIDQNAFIKIRTFDGRKNVAGFLDPLRAVKWLK